MGLGVKGKIMSRGRHSDECLYSGQKNTLDLCTSNDSNSMGVIGGRKDRTSCGTTV